jgi:hypothetical protein
MLSLQREGVTLRHTQKRLPRSAVVHATGPITSIASQAALAGITLAVATNMLVEPANAQDKASVKATVTPQELVSIVTEDFIQRKYLVTGDLTKEVSRTAVSKLQHADLVPF